MHPCYSLSFSFHITPKQPQKSAMELPFGGLSLFAYIAWSCHSQGCLCSCILTQLLVMLHNTLWSLEDFALLPKHYFITSVLTTTNFILHATLLLLLLQTYTQETRLIRYLSQWGRALIEQHQDQTHNRQSSILSDHPKFLQPWWCHTFLL